MPNVLIPVCAALVALAAPGDADDLAAIVAAEATAVLRGGPVAGIGVGVLRDGAPAFAGGFGCADLEHAVPVTEHTFFRLASVSKQFTAAALLQQVEDGTLALDQKLSRHFPLFRAPGGDPTLAQLLNHTSGIASLTSLPDFERRMLGAESVADVVAMFDGQPADFAPGEGFSYNNSAYVLAGEIAARAAGVDYPTLVQQRLFAPLGMTESGYAFEDRLIPQRARGYVVADGKLAPARFMNMEVPRGAGALGSTVHDLLIWARALPALEVIGDPSFTAMTEPTRLPIAGHPDDRDGGDAACDTIDYGYGLMRGTHESVAWYGHGGNINGFNTWIEWLPDHDLALVVLVNTEGDHAHALAERLVRRLVPEAAPGTPIASSNHATTGAAPPLTVAPVELAPCLGTYASGKLPLRLVQEDAGVIAHLGGQPGATLRFVGRRDGRLDFAFEADPTKHLLLDPAATPPRATLTGQLTLRRFLRTGS